MMSGYHTLKRFMGNMDYSHKTRTELDLTDIDSW